jgi:hypothetical protein
VIRVALKLPQAADNLVDIFFQAYTSLPYFIRVFFTLGHDFIQGVKFALRLLDFFQLIK